MAKCTEKNKKPWGRHELLFRKLTWNMESLHWELHRFLQTANYAPRNIRGTEIPNIRTSRQTMVVNGMHQMISVLNEEVDHEEYDECDSGKQ